MKVGDTLWKFDTNRRKYGPDRRCIYREHFTPYRIMGETAQSWLVEEISGRATKVNKRTLASAGKNGFGGHQWFTAEGVEDDIWRNEHRHKIIREVERADAKNLRRIAEVLELRFKEPETKDREVA